MHQQGEGTSWELTEVQLEHAQAHASRSLCVLFSLFSLTARGCDVHIHTRQAVSQTTTTIIIQSGEAPF